MTLRALALAQRALVLNSRANAPHLLRLLLVIVMLASVCSAFAGRKTLGAPGLHLFEWLVYANFVFITLVGIAAFSSVIAEEKELGTLGLLQLAGFGGAAIVIGKSIGQLLGMALLLVVQVPFAFLAITLGGVTAHQVLAAWLILLAWLLLVYALALLASVIAPHTGSAARFAALALLAYHVMPWLGVTLAGSPTGPAGPLFWVSRAAMDNTALSALTDTMDTGFAAPLLDQPVLVTLALAASLFMSALLAFRRCSRNEGQTASGQSGHRATAARPRALPCEHAFFWKDLRFVHGGVMGMALRMVVYVALPLALGMRPEAALALLALMTIDVLVMANRVFGEELRSGTLPLLVLVPVPLYSIASSKANACAALILPPLIASFLTTMRALGVHDACGFALVGVILVLSLLIPAFLLAVYVSLRLPRASLEFTVLAAVLMVTACLTMGETCLFLVPMWLFVLLVSVVAFPPVIGNLVRQRAGE